jgi:hypothetical protein
MKKRVGREYEGWEYQEDMQISFQNTFTER